MIFFDCILSAERERERVREGDCAREREGPIAE